MKTVKFNKSVFQFEGRFGFHSLFVACLFLLPSCNKFVEVPPPTTQLVSQNVFTSDASAISTITGTYSRMISSIGFASGGASSIVMLAGLSSDELVNYSTDPNTNSFYKNDLTSTNTVLGTSLWNEGFNIIYSSNAILNGLVTATGMTDSTKKLLTGEAKFIRAFCNFYLINLFGSIPLINTTNYQINAIAARVPAPVVYDSIIADLKDAQTLLLSDFSFSGGERIMPNKWVATAMLSRVYLYSGNWSAAEDQATLVINNTGLFSLQSDLNSVFLANSSEAIWQLQPVMPDINTNEGNIFILTDYPGYYSMSQSLIDSFETGDNRRMEWVDSLNVNGQIFYYPYKYKIKTGASLSEYSMVLRLAEQYLIRSEARAHLNNISGSASDLNLIRQRAGLGATSANDQAALFSAIQHERQIELNTEWGHRWLDLKRTGQADPVLSALKFPNWQSKDTLYPIPKADLSTDPNLTQNPGY